MRLKMMVLLYFLSLTVLNAEQVRINFDHLKISKFIEIVAEVIEKNILVNEEIKGEVYLESNEPLEKSSLIPLLNDVLKPKKMVLVNMGEFYQIVPQRDIHY